MQLTLTQLAVLKADITNDPTLNAFPHDPDGASAVAALYNLTAVPDHWVWRTRITAREVRDSVVWTEYIGRSVGEKAAFEMMMTDGEINGASPNIRSGITDIFSGASAATTRNNLTALAKRLASRFEKLFAVGTGSNAAPATMAVEGPIDYHHIVEAWAA